MKASVLTQAWLGFVVISAETARYKMLWCPKWWVARKLVNDNGNLIIKSLANLSITIAKLILAFNHCYGFPGSEYKQLITINEPSSNSMMPFSLLPSSPQWWLELATTDKKFKTPRNKFKSLTRDERTSPRGPMCTIINSLNKRCANCVHFIHVKKLLKKSRTLLGNEGECFFGKSISVYNNEKRDTAIALSSSRAGIKYSILLPWLRVFKYINPCCTALAGGI